MDDQSPYTHPEDEKLSREERSELESERLQETIRRCAGVPFYAQQVKEMGIKAEAIT